MLAVRCDHGFIVTFAHTHRMLYTAVVVRLADNEDSVIHRRLGQKKSNATSRWQNERRTCRTTTTLHDERRYIVCRHCFSSCCMPSPATKGLAAVIYNGVPSTWCARQAKGLKFGILYLWRSITLPSNSSIHSINSNMLIKQAVWVPVLTTEAFWKLVGSTEFQVKSGEIWRDSWNNVALM
jgi:hypothetical protein